MAFFPCSLESYLILFRRLNDTNYVDPLERENGGLGFDVIRGMAAVFARVDEAANRSQQSYFLAPHSEQTGEPATGPRKASGFVTVSRLAPADWELVLPVGTVVEAAYPQDSYGDRLLVQRYLTTEELTLAPGVSGPLPVAVEAEFPGFEGNIGPGLVDAFQEQARASIRALVVAPGTLSVLQLPTTPTDEFQASFRGRYGRLTAPSPLPPLVGVTATTPRRIVNVGSSTTAFIEPPVDAVDVGKVVVFEVEQLADFSVSVAQPDPMTGGSPDGLGAIATDRSTARQPGETDEQFRDRLRILEDVVSPAAIVRTIKRVLAGTGIRWAFYETRDVNGLGGFILDVHPLDLTPSNAFTIPKLSGSELVGQGIFLLDESTYRRHFVVTVSPSGLGEYGFAYDTMVGALSAFDQQSGTGFFDGSPVRYFKAIARLWESLHNDVRAAGVGFDIVVDDNL